jgi:hypothetical protein
VLDREALVEWSIIRGTPFIKGCTGVGINIRGERKIFFLTNPNADA